MSSFVRGHRRALIAAAVVVVLLGGGAVGGFLLFQSTGRSVTVPGDQIGCVYSSLESGHNFIRSIQPGEHVTIGKTDELVQLPTNDIVYNITSRNSSPEAPQHLLAYTKGQVGLFVEGVLKFRFNTAGASACKWYSRYGMQSTYGDMGFTVAAKSEGVQESSHTGFYRFLAEAQGNTMKQVVHDESTGFTWQQLTYGADPSVKTAVSAEPVSITYGKHIGLLVTKYLALDLGGNFFCGVQPGLTGGGASEGCPPMYFQLTSEYPRDKTLSDEHEATRRLDAQLTQQRQAAKLQAQNQAAAAKLQAETQAAAIKAAVAQRKVLQAQIVNTRLTALNDPVVQKCLIYVGAGLDCAGKKQQIIVAGVPK
jgi:hypothetical protein